MNEYAGQLNGKGMRIGIVVSRFNELVTTNLLKGALDALLRHGVNSDDVTVAWVPGAFDIPVVAKKLASNGKNDAVICLGTVIRGATAHFDFVAGQSAAGVARVALDCDVPVIFGVLTTETIEQALERAGTKSGNKGYDCAVNAIEMVSLLSQLNTKPHKSKL